MNESTNHPLVPQVFNYHDHPVRTVLKDGAPWWVAKDACEALGLSQVSRVMSRLDPDEGGLLELPHPQRPGECLVVNGVNESGLFNLILCSRKPQAKEFKRWITHEVLPAIRKTGAYVVPGVSEQEASLAAHTAALEGVVDAKIAANNRFLLEAFGNLATGMQAMCSQLLREQRRATLPKSGLQASEKKAIVKCIQRVFIGSSCPCCYKHPVLEGPGELADGAEFWRWDDSKPYSLNNAILICHKCCLDWRSGKKASAEAHFRSWQARLKAFVRQCRKSPQRSFNFPKD